MRHSFAVAALLRWYENDEDVQVQLPRLAMYMGHVSIASTAYYLRLMPAVLQRAGERFARSPPRGGRTMRCPTLTDLGRELVSFFDDFLSGHSGG